MGRKQRKNRDKDVDSLDDQVDDRNHGQRLDHPGGDNDDDANSRTSSNGNTNNTTNTNSTKKKPSVGGKDLDFAQRRELQRKQAAEKRRSKMKCHICGQAGHARRECPGVADDGRGMSRYRGRTSNVKNEKQKYEAKKQERLQKIQNNNGGRAGDTSNPNDDPPKLPFDYPQGFSAASQQQRQTEEKETETELDSFLYYDSSCDDILATLNYIKEGRGKTKLSKREALQEYQQALEGTDAHSNFGGMISRSLIKPSRPWIQPTDVPLPHKVWYLLGLARDYLFNDIEVDTAVTTLVNTLKSHEDTIIGFWAVLDYSPQYRKRPGCDSVSQLRRARATCRAAAEAGVTVQLQVLPGAPSSSTLDTDSPSLTGTDYAQVLLDLQTLLSEMMELHPKLTVVLSHWCGMAQHMTIFLTAFSQDNLVIGLDGAVSFSKASVLHECAFDVPLDRLILGTGTVIPSEIANALGRDAFYHAGLWPFVAKAVAHYKKTVSTMEVARAASALTIKLYPQLVPTRTAHESTDHNEEEAIGERNETKEDNNNGDEAGHI